MLKYPYSLSPDSVSVMVPKKGMRTFTRDDPMYEKIVEKIRESDDEGLISLLTEVERTIEDQYEGFEVKDGIVFVKNEKGEAEDLPRTLGSYILNFAKEGLPYQPLIKLWKRF
jgi:hypothetical protein